MAPFERMKNNQNARPCGMPKCLPLSRQNGRTRGGREPCLRMGLQTLRQAQAIGMRLLWGGRMGFSGHFCAEWRIFGMEGRSRCRPRQKSLQDERIEGEGGKPLPQHCPDHGPCGAHGRDQGLKMQAGSSGRMAASMHFGHDLMQNQSFPAWSFPPNLVLINGPASLWGTKIRGRD